MEKLKNIKKKYRYLFNILRFIVTGVLVYIIFKKINLQNTIITIKKADIKFIFLGIIVFFFFHLITVFRWKFMLFKSSLNLAYLKLLKFHFISLFFQNFLPSTLGGDFVKGYLAFKGNPKIKVAISIFISRFSGIISLVLLASISSYLLGIKNPIFSNMHWYIFGIFGILLLIFIFLFSNWFKKIIIFIYRLFKIKGEKYIDIFFYNLNIYKNIKIIIPLFGLSLIVQIIPVLAHFFLFSSTGENISITYFFLFVPFVIFASLLPITLNGIGIRENIYFFFLKSMVDIKDPIFAFLFFILGVHIFFSLIGGILTLFQVMERGKK